MSDTFGSLSPTLQWPEEEQEPMGPMYVDMSDYGEPQIDEEGIMTHDDGSMTFPFGRQDQGEQGPVEFDSNLAEHMSEAELNKIATDLLRGIEDDIQSSAEWRNNLALGIKLLGTQIEPSATDAGTTSTVFEGQHKTTHPLLLEACLTFQANARASLLPASGPVKIRDDQPRPSTKQQAMPTMQPGMGHNGGPKLDEGDDNKQNNPFQPQQPQQPQVNVNVTSPQGQNQGQHAYGGGVEGYARGGETMYEPAGDYIPHDIEREPFSSPQYQPDWPGREPVHPPRDPYHHTPQWTPEQQEYLRGIWRPDDRMGANGGRYANGGAVGYADGGTPFASPPGNGMNGVGQFAPQMPQGQSGGAPQMPMMGGQPPQQEPKTERDLLAEAMEKDFNSYLTAVDKNYYPDTDRMLFNTGLSGTTVKKVYNCPLRRRPVSESCPVEDFIVSNAFADLCNMPRITQRIAMRPSVLKRMQLVGAYRDIELGRPEENDKGSNEVKQMKADTLGVDINAKDPEDLDHELYECYTELELEQFAPEQFKGEGLALPYKIVIDKSSEKILEIRRNWKEDDEQCSPKEYFVDFSYVKAFGFYGLGLMHILGNITRTLTALIREMVDAGMFANFPGFVYAKGAGRQLTNNFRVPPGGGVGLDTGLQDVRNAVMPLPYKDVTAGAFQLLQYLTEYGQRLGGTANINVGEGKQDAPVGTTLAMIEQATKPLGAVLKRLHSAQGREFQLLKERFKEDPEAFWRFNKKPAMVWQKEQFLQALDDFDLVPVSDPNNPTHMHRMAKASLIFQAASAAPTLFNQPKVWERIGDAAEIENPQDLLAEQQGGQQPDPFALAALQDSKTKAMGVQIKAQEVSQKGEAQLVQTRMELADREAERQSRERIANLKVEGDKIKLAGTMAIHSSEQEAAAAESALRIDTAAATNKLEHTKLAHAAATHQTQLVTDAHMHGQRLAADSHMQGQQIAADGQKHRDKLATDATLKHHDINTKARAAHHKTVTDAAVKREQIAKMAAQRKAAST